MNYCDSNTPTAEQCECYSFNDKFHEPEVHAICKVGQVCMATFTAKAKYIYECLSLCQAGQPGPCYRISEYGEPIKIASGHVGLQLTPENTDLTFFPIAEFDTFLTAQSGCLVDAGETPEWVVCESAHYCGKLTETTAKCAYLCPSKSVVPEECLCKAQDGKITLAQPNQFCGEDGSVSQFNDELCVLNSFGNGTCRCETSQNACPATSVCVSNSGTVQCMPACKLNADNRSGFDCACRGQTTTQIVSKTGICVVQSDGAAALHTLPICNHKQIGPCTCEVMSQSGLAQYLYTDASKVCYLSSNDNMGNAAPLMPLGSMAVEYQLCQNTVKNPTSTNTCQIGQYCMAVGDTTVKCLPPCYKDYVTENYCACASPDGKTATFAAVGDFCSASGEIVEKPSDSCHPSANVVNSCKCLKTDQNHCYQGQYCGEQNGVQTCKPMCVFGVNSVVSNCVCPYSGSDALVPEDSVCACQYVYPFQLCAAAATCQPGQIGPCGISVGAGQPSYVNSESAYVETEYGGVALLLCRTNVITNQQCACEVVETPAKATAIEAGSACMHRPDGTTEIVPECGTGLVSGFACACRILKNTGGASYCDVGSVCKENPADNTKQVCWRPCSEANPCLDGKKCIGSGDNAHCEFTCAAGCVTCPEVPEFCTECASGYYLSGAEGLKSCAKCPATCTSCISADSCQGCATGYAGDACNACAKGYELKDGQCTKKTGSLSAGAIAGIAVAAVVAAGGIAAGIFFAVKAMKTKKANVVKQSAVEPVGQQAVLKVAE